MRVASAGYTLFVNSAKQNVQQTTFYFCYLTCFFFFCFFVFVILYLFVNSAKQNVQQTTFHFNTLSFEENKARFFM